MRRNSLIIVLFFAALAAACGGRSVIPGGDSGTNTNANTNTNTNTNGECTDPADCVIAQKWDACCSCPVVASQADLAADPCLIPLEQSAIPPECQVDCPAMPCPLCPQWGRTPTCEANQCTWAEAECTEDTECVAAIRVDNCCQSAFPATHADIAADPCLVYYPEYWEEIPQQCAEQWDPACAIMDCWPSPPPSRAMVCSSEGCAYTTECADASDCTLLINGRTCCPCPTAWPASMIGHDPCLVQVGEQIPEGCAPAACLEVLCEACEPVFDIQCESDDICEALYINQHNSDN